MESIELLHLPEKIWQFILLHVSSDACYRLKEMKKNPLPYPVFCFFFKKEESITSFGIAACDPSLKRVYISALYTNNWKKNQTEVKEILLSFEKKFKKFSPMYWTHHYLKEENRSPYLEDLLQKQGWSPPFVLEHRYYFDVISFSPSWYEKSLKKSYSSPFFQEFFWKNLTLEEKEEIKALEEGLYTPFYLDPLENEERIETCNSLGLKWKDQIVGWMVTHREDDQTISYSDFYVDPRLTSFKDGLLLLIHSIEKQKQAKIPIGILDLPIQTIPLTWRLFVKKRLVPHAFDKKILKEIRKVSLISDNK